MTPYLKKWSERIEKMHFLKKSPKIASKRSGRHITQKIQNDASTRILERVFMPLPYLKKRLFCLSCLTF